MDVVLSITGGMIVASLLILVFAAGHAYYHKL